MISKRVCDGDAIRVTVRVNYYTTVTIGTIRLI